MGFLDGAQYLTLPSSTGTWVIQDWLPQSGMLNVYGEAKLGKSFLTLQLAEAVANPKRRWLLNMPVMRHGPACYLQLDTPRSLWIDRLAQDLAPTDLNFENVKFADTQTEGLPFPFDILGDGGDWLREACKEVDPVVVIVDTLRESFGGEENDSGTLRNVVNQFKRACGSAAIVFVSHSRKNAGDSSSLMGDQRGSSYLVGRMDCILRVNEKNVQYKGRAVSEETVKIRRTPQYLLEIADEYEITVEAIIDEMAGQSARAIARRVQEQFPKRSFDAIRSVVRRRLGGRDADGSGRARKISFD